ncbi:hypothetical protein AVEN_43092-1 [Araneus ventricosus]|uniref:DUF4817 domain-containing protein n=1 Tax=Araneus ventricosus TaxID=182803 RepID=A0A4Y2PJ59_ARAVE|nr:hypothetical protein AVEN_43092-1 [Araneus ventricosus]
MELVSHQFHAILKISPKVSYSTEDRMFIVKNSFLCGENTTLLLRKWSATFRNRPKPSRAMVGDLIRKFERFGYQTHDLRGNAGAQVTVRTEEVINAHTIILVHCIDHLINQIFFLWGHIKDLVYKKKPTDLIKRSITDSFASVKRKTLELVTDNFVTRFRYCITSDGSYFEKILH